MKTYLVTGGAGFIGSNFVIYMLQKYDDVKIINLDKLTYAGNLENLQSVENNSNYEFVEGDICDSAKLSQIFSHNEIDYVVNFAAESHVDRSIKNPEVFVQTNVLGTAALLNAARKAWVENDLSDVYRKGVRFVQISTDEVYGSLGSQGYFSETTKLGPRSPYSASKASADLIVLSYYSTYKMPVNITRCSNNYGPFQFPEKLVPLMINNIFNEKNLPVYGDGLNIRDWLYVSDHCAAIDLVLQNGREGEVYNIGGHNEKTNLELVQTILNICSELKSDGIRSRIVHVADRKGHDRRYAIDASKIESELGFRPKVSFEEGIEATINWFASNKRWLKNVVSGVYQSYYSDHYGKV